MWRWRWTRWPDWTYQYHEACIPNQWWRLTTDQTNEYKYRIQHSPLSFSSHGTSLGSSLSQELPMWTGGYQNHCESRPSIYRPPTLRLTISAITDWWRCSDAQRVPLGGTHPYQEHTGERLEVWGNPGQRQVGVREDSFAENILLFLFVVRFVVTAAHCVSEGGISITVTLGKKIYIFK